MEAGRTTDRHLRAILSCRTRHTEQAAAIIAPFRSPEAG